MLILILAAMLSAQVALYDSVPTALQYQSVWADTTNGLYMGASPIYYIKNGHAIWSDDGYTGIPVGLFSTNLGPSRFTDYYMLCKDTIRGYACIENREFVLTEKIPVLKGTTLAYPGTEDMMLVTSDSVGFLWNDRPRFRFAKFGTTSTMTYGTNGKNLFLCISDTGSMFISKVPGMGYVARKLKARTGQARFCYATDTNDIWLTRNTGWPQLVHLSINDTGMTVRTPPAYVDRILKFKDAWYGHRQFDSTIWKTLDTGKTWSMYYKRAYKAPNRLAIKSIFKYKDSILYATIAGFEGTYNKQDTLFDITKIDPSSSSEVVTPRMVRVIPNVMRETFSGVDVLGRRGSMKANGMYFLKNKKVVIRR